MCRLAITGNKDIKVPDENTHINDTENCTWRSCWLCSSIWNELFILKNFFPSDQTVNSAFYKEVLQCLRRAIWWKRQGEWWTVWCSIVTLCPATQSPSTSLTGKTFLCYWNQCSFPVYHHVTSGCSPNSKKWWNASHLKGLKTIISNIKLSAGDPKRRLPEMFPTVAEVLEKVCIYVSVGSILKGINDEISIQSFRHSPNFLIKPCIVVSLNKLAYLIVFYLHYCHEICLLFCFLVSWWH
jgi:hypothetical protein